jgi:UTP-glucose-1-phosphate uridylyltransferase
MAVEAGGRAKELLPVGGRPLLAHALEDLAESGITNAMIVVSPSKPEIRATFGDRFGAMALHYVTQPVPRGLADALALAEPFAAGEPFVGWLPDNLFQVAGGGRPATAQLIDGWCSAGDHRSFAAALIERPTDTFDPVLVGSAGFVTTTPGRFPGVHRIDRVHSKGERPPLPTPTFLKGFPLALWLPELFDLIRDERARPSAGELDDTPILQHLARAGALLGVVLRNGTLHDCGVPRGYSAACAALASS